MRRASEFNTLLQPDKVSHLGTVDFIFLQAEKLEFGTEGTVVTRVLRIRFGLPVLPVF